MYLLSFGELLEYVYGNVVVLEQVIGHGVADPGDALRWPQLQQLIPRVLVAVQVADLNLKQRQVTQNLKIFLFSKLIYSTQTNKNQ